MSKKRAKEINDFAQETARYVSAGHETLYYAKQWGEAYGLCLQGPNVEIFPVTVDGPSSR